MLDPETLRALSDAYDRERGKGGLASISCATWSSPEKVDTASAAGLMVSLDGDFGFENEY